MATDLEKIEHFIAKHHVLTLATHDADEISACSLFYVYDQKSCSFIVASSEETTHIQHIKKNSHIACNILLETNTIGKIEGLQCFGSMQLVEDEVLRKLYLQRYVYARALNPLLWQIKLHRFKLTDNRLGFGKKIIVEL